MCIIRKENKVFIQQRRRRQCTYYIYIYVLYILYTTGTLRTEIKRYILVGTSDRKNKERKNGNWCFFFSSTIIYYCVHLRRKIAGFLFSRQMHLLYYFEKYLHIQSGYKKIHIKISNTYNIYYIYIHIPTPVIYVQKYI